MAQNRKHQPLLRFIKNIVDVPAEYSKEDLFEFRSRASRQYPVLVPLIEQYIHLAESADTKDLLNKQKKSKRRTITEETSESGLDGMHLFDMLRDKRLFPSNSELSDFAGNALPRMSRHRFDKMARGDIAARIIEYLETRDKHTRQDLEASMREAMAFAPHATPERRKSFVTKWESIIKGIPL